MKTALLIHRFSWNTPKIHFWLKRKFHIIMGFALELEFRCPKLLALVSMNWIGRICVSFLASYITLLICAKKSDVAGQTSFHRNCRKEWKLYFAEVIWTCHIYSLHRIYGSIVLGWPTLSLFISRLIQG